MTSEQKETRNFFPCWPNVSNVLFYLAPIQAFFQYNFGWHPLCVKA
jgi:hypothetical protein